MQVSTSFPDSTYSSGNLPSVTTLQADISALETAQNETDSKAIREDGTNAFAANQSMGGYKLTNLGTPSASTDGATLAVVQSLYPVGSLYFNASDSTNPATLLGFGTWVAFGAGRTLIGIDAGDTDFDTAGETGGSKTAQITTDHFPTHGHSFSATTSQNGNHYHNYYTNDDSTGTNYAKNAGADAGTNTLNTSTNGDHTHTVSGTTGNAGSGGAFSIQNKYITVYMWQRTA